MVESMLQQCGYKTGLFTSPHLVDVRERIRLQGSVCSLAFLKAIVALKWPTELLSLSFVLLGTAVTLLSDFIQAFNLQAAYSNTNVYQALLVVFQQPERVR